MTSQKSRCVILADGHHGLRDGVRGLLESEFESVFMVANDTSLLEGAARLKPEIIVVDLSLAGGDLGNLLSRLASHSPGSGVVVLTVHDEATVAKAALAAGAEAVVLKSRMTTDLLAAVEAVRVGKRYLSPELSHDGTHH